MTVEDGVARGGFGTAVLELLAEENAQVPTAVIGLPDHFVEHGTIPVLREMVGLTAAEVARRAEALMPPRTPTGYTNGSAKTAAKIPAGVVS